MVNQSLVERHKYKAKYYDKNSNSPARVIRDLRRLRDLIKQYKIEGLNTIEGNEKEDLIQEYDMSHSEAYNLEFIK